MRKDKEVATELRKTGKTYNEISRVLRIPKSTLSEWFSDAEWDAETKKANWEDQQRKSLVWLNLVHIARAQKLSLLYDGFRDKASEDFERYKSEPLFSAGLMLYLGEGSKCYKNQIGMANSDPAVLKIFIKFIQRYTQVPEVKIKFWLLSYPDLDEWVCLDYWMKMLSLPRTCLYKTQVIQGKSAARKLQYGVGNVRISSTELKVTIEKWLSLISEDLCK